MNTVRFDCSGAENSVSIKQGKNNREMPRKKTKTGFNKHAEGWNHWGFLLLRLTESRVK